MNKITCYDSDGGILKSLTQWDVGQSIVIKGLPTNDAPSVHFCSKGDDKALVVASRFSNTDLVVDVPNILLQKSMPIAAYLYYQQDADSAKTMYTLTINVVPRAKPSDYEYVEDIEYTNWVELTKDAQKLILDMESAYESVSSALQNASSATQNATSAASAANKAASTASAAASSASAASVEASVAADKAELATQAAKIAADRAEGMLFRTVSGELITVSDSAEAPLQGLTVFGRTDQRTTTGKNLLYLPDKSVTSGGLDWKVENGVVTINGKTNTTVNVWADGAWDNTEALFTLAPGTYTTNCTLYSYDGTTRYSNTGTFTIAKSMPVTGVHFGYYEAESVVNKIVYAQVEKGSVLTVWEPYTGGKPSPSPNYPQPLESVGDSGTVSVSVCGKNLLNPDASFKGCITASGSIDNLEDYLYTDYIPSNCTMVVSWQNGTDHMRVARYDEHKNFIDRVLAQNISAYSSYVIEATENVSFIRLSYHGDVSNVQLEISSTATDYEPYKEPTTATVTPVDSSGNSLHLPGIPVTSGGNYTDPVTKQQWICDEVDLEQRVYVQRVGVLVLNGTQGRYSDSQGVFILDGLENAAPKPYEENFSLCSHYAYGAYPNISMPDMTFKVSFTGGFTNLYIKDSRYTTAQGFKDAFAASPVTVLYQLENAVQHGLSDEALAQYAALRTNYPNTTVFNNVGANMEVKYATPTSALPIAGGRMAGPIGMADNRITDVADPVNERDAANRGYVDKGIDAVKNIISDLHHNAIKEASGDIISLADSAEAPLQGLKVFGKTQQRTTTGKNLFNGILVDGYKESISGELVSANGIYKTMDFYIPADGEYTISFGVGVRIIRRDSVTPNVDCTKITYTLNAGDHYISFRNSESTVWDESVKIQVEKGSTATAWEPYTGGKPSPNPDYPQTLESVGDSGTVSVTTCGKNLLPYPYFREYNSGNGGIFTAQDDGGVVISGTPSNWIGIELMQCAPIVKTGKIYSRIFGEYSNCVAEFIIRDEKQEVLIATSGKDFVLGLDAYPTAHSWSYTLKRDLNNVALSGVVYPVFSFEDVTEYEPRNGTTVTVTTPNGLPGIPVTSGGNYTDPVTKQQWICDEVDFEKGVYVQRVGKQVLDGTQGRYSDSQGTFILDGLNNAVAKSYDETFALCTHYVYGAYSNTGMPELTFKISGTNGTVNLYIKDSRYTTTQAWKDALTANPVTVLYPLQEVVLYDLSVEEFAQFAALHTNYPNTTIYNNAGAKMEVKYATPDAVLSMSGGAVANLKVPAPQTAVDAVPKYYVDNVDKKVETLKGIVKSLHSNIVQETSGELITVSDASDLELAGLRIFGKTEQRTTTGKNLLPKAANTLEVDGVTFTVNEDGSVTANSKPNGTANCYFYISVPLEVGKQYTMNGCPKNGSATTYYTMIQCIKDGSVAFPADETGSGKTFTVQDGMSGFAYVICIRNGYTANNLTFYPMIRLASITDDTYEPYTGGAPSPSPDYPQAMESVGDVTVGKNLLDESSLVSSSGTGRYTEIVDGRIHFVNADGLGFTPSVTLTLPPGTYYFGISYQTVSGSPYFGYIINEGNAVWAYNTVITLTETSRVMFRLTTAGTNSIGEYYANVWVTANDSQTAYEPYTIKGGMVNVTACGKNLLKPVSIGRFLDNQSQAFSYDGISWTLNHDGTINGNGKNTAAVGARTYCYIRPANITLNPGTYSFSDLTAVQFSDGSRFYSTFTLTERKILDLVYIEIQNQASINTVYKPQIEVGSATTEYEPYKEPKTLPVTTVNADANLVKLHGIPVSSGGNYTDENGQQWICDYIDVAQGKYVQRIDRIVYDGTNLSFRSAAKAGAYTGTIENSGYLASYDCDYAMCAHYPLSIITTLSTEMTKDKSFALYRHDDPAVLVSGIFVYDTGFKDANELNAWLSKNPLTVLFARRNPIKHDLTTEELAAYTSKYGPNAMIYGKTIQPGTPSPENPVPLINTSLVLRNATTGLTGLCGIPVKSGGNYTDENGQQWLCDEVDFAKGVYVQRVGKFIANGTETWTKSDNKFYTTLNQAKRYLSDSGTHILSTRFQDIGSSYLPFTPGTMSMYTANFATYPGENWLYVCASDSHSSSSDIRSYFSANPTEFIFELAEEKHIPLSEIDPDALAQYAALHTNYPNTTIFNDAGAHMELKYVADTKKYVDNKFAELAAALISNT